MTSNEGRAEVKDDAQRSDYERKPGVRPNHRSTTRMTPKQSHATYEADYAFHLDKLEILAE